MPSTPLDWKMASKDAKRRHRPYLGSNWCREDVHLSYRSYVTTLPPTIHSTNPHFTPAVIAAAFPYSTPLPSNAGAVATLPGGVLLNWRTKAGDAAKSLTMELERDFLKEPMPSLPIYIDYADVTDAAVFNDFYQKYNVPCLIKGIVEGEGWGCGVGEESEWHPKSLASDPLASVSMKCGEDDDGNVIKMRLSTFLEYLEHNVDDSPLYIFDSSSIKKENMANKDNVIARGYKPPSFFEHDLWSYVGDSRRPPHKWFLVGPERSGTTVHIDPLATSAWNTAVVGRKRWVIFPPETQMEVVKAKKLYEKAEDDEAANYFMKVLGRLKEQNPDIVMYEFTQNPGETLFVPSGWWHAVLNLEDTCAITQNFCSPWNFDKVWREARDGRRKSCWKWLERLVERGALNGQQLADRAHELNTIDGWTPKAKESEEDKLKKKREKKEAKEAKKAAKKEKKDAQSQSSLPSPPAQQMNKMSVDGVTPPAAVSAGASDESASDDSDDSEGNKRKLSMEEEGRAQKSRIGVTVGGGSTTGT